MKIALITTTIFVPGVLRLYRRLGPSVKIFVAGDRHTPHDDVRALLADIGDAHYLSDRDQEERGYRCSELIGWNRIMRRNIALLEAIRSGADVIVTVDDDNIPIARDYFADFERVLGAPFDGPEVTSPDGWFNPGEYLVPPVYHRGFPHALRHRPQEYRISQVIGARVAVAAGLWFGDPDVDAVDRISGRPEVRSAAQVLHAGLSVAPGIYTPVNSQNTAYLREVAPLFMVWTGVGRFDDIWASYFAQRILRERGMSVHFGRPFVWQQRNPHDLWVNLRDELLGMEKTIEFCRTLDDATLRPGPLLAQMRALYSHLEGADFLPEIVCRLGQAWCDDLEEVGI